MKLSCIARLLQHLLYLPPVPVYLFVFSLGPVITITELTRCRRLGQARQSCEQQLTTAGSSCYSIEAV